MSTALRQVCFTRAEYASYERSSNVKHELLDGVIYATAGGTPEHAAVAGNVVSLLNVALRVRLATSTHRAFASGCSTAGSRRIPT